MALGLQPTAEVPDDREAKDRAGAPRSDLFGSVAWRLLPEGSTGDQQNR
jgi:hypothetical protein